MDGGLLHTHFPILLIFNGKRCTLTWLHPIGDHVLRSVHDVHVGLQCSVEGLDLMYRQVQHRVSGGVIVVDLHDSAVCVDAAPRGQTKVNRDF